MDTARIQEALVRGRHFWQPHVEALAQSGLSRREYCRQHNLSYHAATYWLRKLPQAVVKGESSFSLIEVPTRLAAHSPLRLHIGSCMIELDPGFDQATLARTLAVLEQGR
jgi:hypothetical protein